MFCSLISYSFANLPCTVYFWFSVKSKLFLSDLYLNTKLKYNLLRIFRTKTDTCNAFCKYLEPFLFILASQNNRHLSLLDNLAWTAHMFCTFVESAFSKHIIYYVLWSTLRFGNLSLCVPKDAKYFTRPIFSSERRCWQGILHRWSVSD